MRNTIYLATALALIGLHGCKKDGTKTETKAPAPSVKTGKTQPATMQPKPKKRGLVQDAQWTKLASFAPDALGGYTAVGEAKGGVHERRGIARRMVRRSYKASNKELSLRIMELPPKNRMKERFERALKRSEDSDKVMKQGTKVQDYPAILQWVKQVQIARLTILVGDRYSINLGLRPATDGKEILNLAGSLKLTELEKVAPAQGQQPQGQQPQGQQPQSQQPQGQQPQGQQPQGQQPGGQKPGGQK